MIVIEFCDYQASLVSSVVSSTEYNNSTGNLHYLHISKVKTMDEFIRIL